MNEHIPADVWLLAGTGFSALIFVIFITIPGRHQGFLAVLPIGKVDHPPSVRVSQRESCDIVPYGAGEILVVWRHQLRVQAILLLREPNVSSRAVPIATGILVPIAVFLSFVAREALESAVATVLFPIGCFAAGILIDRAVARTLIRRLAR